MLQLQLKSMCQYLLTSYIDQNRSIIAQTDSDLWSIQKLKQDLMMIQKSAFKYLDFLGKYTNVVFFVEPRKGDG